MVITWTLYYMNRVGVTICTHYPFHLKNKSYKIAGLFLWNLLLVKPPEGVDSKWSLISILYFLKRYIWSTSCKNDKIQTNNIAVSTNFINYISDQKTFVECVVI